jgi:hypothetical protein
VNEIETKVLDRAMTDPESSLDEMFMLRYAARFAPRRRTPRRLWHGAGRRAEHLLA